MKFNDLHENGAFTSSGDIAGNPTGGSMMRRSLRGGENDWHQSIANDKTNAPSQEAVTRQREQLALAKAKIKKQNGIMGKLSSFIASKQRNQFRISESFDMDDVVSRLKGLEGGANEESTVSFGVEDDEGNLMKVTVRGEQAKEFEERLANELADAMRRKEVTGNETGVSMAELLYNLNSEFDIVDVQFPQIPADAVYNADKANYNVADTAQDVGDTGGMDDGMGGEDEFGADFPAEFDDQGAGGMGDDGMDPMAGGDAPDDMGGDDGMGDEFGLDGEDDGMGEDPMSDAEGVEDFVDEPEASMDASPENLLTAVLNMLKADAEAKTAEAQARTEEARAKQAEWTAVATQNSVSQQEEIVRMEAEMDEQKNSEKAARRIADLAKYRVNKVAGMSSQQGGGMPTQGGMAMGESTKLCFTEFLDTLLEFDEFDTIQTLQRQKTQLRTKYQTAAGDDTDTQQYKRESLMHANREIDAKIKRVNAANKYKKKMEMKQGQPQQGQQNQQQNQQGQQQQGQQQNQQGQPPQGQPTNAVR